LPGERDASEDATIENDDDPKQVRTVVARSLIQIDGKFEAEPLNFRGKPPVSELL
jgi:hypothetical protein